MALAESGLRYIANSPSEDFGGFHPETVRTAKAALRLIARLKRRLRMGAKADLASNRKPPPKKLKRRFKLKVGFPTNMRSGRKS